MHTPRGGLCTGRARGEDSSAQVCWGQVCRGQVCRGTRDRGGETPRHFGRFSLEALSVNVTSSETTQASLSF